MADAYLDKMEKHLAWFRDEMNDLSAHAFENMNKSQTIDSGKEKDIFEKRADRFVMLAENYRSAIEIAVTTINDYREKVLKE